MHIFFQNIYFFKDVTRFLDAKYTMLLLSLSKKKWTKLAYWKVVWEKMDIPTNLVDLTSSYLINEGNLHMTLLSNRFSIYAICEAPYPFKNRINGKGDVRCGRFLFEHNEKVLAEYYGGQCIGCEEHFCQLHIKFYKICVCKICDYTQNIYHCNECNTTINDKFKCVHCGFIVKIE